MAFFVAPDHFGAVEELALGGGVGVEARGIWGGEGDAGGVGVVGEEVAEDLFDDRSRLRAVEGVFGEEGGGEAGEFGVGGFVVGVGEGRGGRVEVGLEDLEGGSDVFKGGFAGGEGVDDAAEGVEVRARVEGLADDLFGRHKGNRAEDCASLCDRGALIDGARESKVSQLDVIGGRLEEQDVCRLQVAVNQAAAVDVVEGVGDLKEDREK